MVSKRKKKQREVSEEVVCANCQRIRLRCTCTAGFYVKVGRGKRARLIAEAKAVEPTIYTSIAFGNGALFALDSQGVISAFGHDGKIRALVVKEDGTFNWVSTT